MFDNMKKYMVKVIQLGETRYILGGGGLLMLSVLLVGLVQNPQALHPYFTARGAVSWGAFSLLFWLLTAGLYFTRLRNSVHLLAGLAIGVVTIPSVGFGVWANVLFLCLSAYACGDAIFRKVFLIEPIGAVRRAQAVLAGLAVYVTCMNILVHFPVNYSFTYVCLMGLPLILNRQAVVSSLVRLCESCSSIEWQNRWEYAAFGLIAYFMLIHFVHATQPEQMFDALAMHLVMAHQVSVNHFWDFDFINHIWAVMPMNGDWLYTIAYVLGGEFSARFANVAMLILMLVIIVVASRRFLSRGMAFLVGALFLSSPLVHLETSSLFIENTWAAFSLAAVFALLNYRQESRPTYLYLAMLFLGAGVATKMIGLFLLAIVAVIALPTMVRTLNVWIALKVVGISALIAVCIGCIPYVNAYVLTHNPIYPFFNALFKSPYLDPNWTFDQPHFKQGVSFSTLYDATFHSNKFVEAVAGVPGFQYLLFLPLALIAVVRKPGHGVPVMLAIAIAFVVLVFQFQSYLRYIYPVFPLFAIAIAYLFAVARESGRLIFTPLVGGAVILVFLNAWAMPGAAGAYRDFPIINAALGKHWLTPDRKAIGYLNTVCGDRCRVGVLSDGVIAGLDGKAFTHNWHTWQFTIKLRSAKDVAAVGNIVREYKLNHLLVRGGDASLSKPIRDFIAQTTQKVFSFQGVSVYRINRETMLHEVLINHDFNDGLTGWSKAGEVVFNRDEKSVTISDKNFLTQVIPASEGTMFRTSITARCRVKGSYVRLQANWLNKEGGFLSATIYPELCDDVYKRFDETMEAPAGASMAIVYLVAHGSYDVSVKDISFAAY